MKSAIAAVLALAASASAAYTPEPSFITCKESAVACKYGYDSTVTRCKPWDGSDYACTKICCASPPPPPPSFVRCDSKKADTSCKYGYKSDPKEGGVMRCKLWEGSTHYCSAKVCCKLPPPPPPPKPSPKPTPKPSPKPEPSSLISCKDDKAKVTCKHGYKTDPKTDGVMRCKLWAGSTVECCEKTCCVLPPAPEPSSSFVRCDTVVGMICPYGYKKDPKVGGVMRCKKWAGSDVECNAITCCAPMHY